MRRLQIGTVPLLPAVGMFAGLAFALYVTCFSSAGGNVIWAIRRPI